MAIYTMVGFILLTPKRLFRGTLEGLLSNVGLLGPQLQNQ
jgi:hypothetical protein